MPLLKPDIQAALRSVGLDKKENQPIADQLDDVGLGLGDTLQALADLARDATHDHIKLGAIRDALKMHGALRDVVPVAPSVTIIIQDPQGDAQSVNPILLPRELIKDTIQ